MSNQASLFAEDTPDPYDPFAEDPDPRTNTMLVAGASCKVPAFWLFCFDRSDLTEIDTEEGKVPGLVTEAAAARRRLAARDAAASQLFPAHAGAWAEFRGAVEAADRRYLKLDAYEVWMMHEDDGDFARLIAGALGWFDSGERAGLEALLSLAEIEGYDERLKRFAVGPDDDPEQFLYGWLEDE